MATKYCKVCGTLVRRNYVTHSQGVRHRYAKMLSRWMADESISFAEMSRRLGVSRERVRQLAVSLPGTATGRQRQGKNAVRKARQTLSEKNGPSSTVIRELEARGIEWHPVRRVDPYMFSGRVIKIGTPPRLTLCLQRYGKRPTGYYTIHRAAQNKCDFYLYDGEVGVLIFPPKEVPTGQTTFLLGAAPKAKGPLHARHDWADHLNAWHLIEEKLKNQKRQSS